MCGVIFSSMNTFFAAFQYVNTSSLVAGLVFIYCSVRAHVQWVSSSRAVCDRGQECSLSPSSTVSSHSLMCAYFPHRAAFINMQWEHQKNAIATTRPVSLDVDFGCGMKNTCVELWNSSSFTTAKPNAQCVSLEFSIRKKNIYIIFFAQCFCLRFFSWSRLP